jgi:hypothetical protein
VTLTTAVRTTVVVYVTPTMTNARPGPAKRYRQRT